MSTAGQGQSEQHCSLLQGQSEERHGLHLSLLNVQGFIPLIHNLTLLILVPQERHIAAVLGVHRELQSPKNLAHLREVDTAEMCYVFMLEMGISYKEKEYLCRRETKILVDKMKFYITCREILKIQMEEVELHL